MSLPINMWINISVAAMSSCFHYTVRENNITLAIISFNSVRKTSVSVTTDYGDSRLPTSCSEMKRLIVLRFLSLLKVTILRNATSCSPVKIDRRFRDAYYLQHGDNLYETTRRNIPEDSNIHTRRRENVKSHVITFSRRKILKSHLI
jgi:hypothetical protein